MGCSSSVPVQPQPTQNGHVVKSSSPGTPPAQRHQQQERAQQRRSNNSDGKNSSSRQPQDPEPDKRSTSPSRPVTAPGGEAENVAVPENNSDENPTAEGEPAQTKPEENEAATSEKPNFNEGALKEYVELENSIREVESKDVENGYKTKHGRLVELYKSIGESKKRVEVLRQQTQKEYQDVVSVTTNYSLRTLFENQSRLDAEVRQEQQEYVDAFNRQEVAEQELKTMQDQYQHLYKEVGDLKMETEELGKLRSKQEELLGKIFNNSYGSEHEYELELELDSLGEQKERIQTAHHRWNGAKVYSEAASKQLAWSARRWFQIATLKDPTVVMTYQMVAETRNCLVAASRNMSSVQSMLAPVQVPYLTKEEGEALHSAIGTIFNDVNIPAQYNKAYQVFLTHYTKSTHLLQWVEKVLTERISKDQQEVNKKFHDKYFELKKERITLIQAVVKEKLGIELEIDLKEPELSSEQGTLTSTSQTDIAQPEVVAKEEGDEQAPDAEDQEGAPPAAVPTEEGVVDGAPAEGGSVEEQESSAPKAVPLEDLAPAPSEADLFGDIEELKKKHEEEMAEFQKNQELNRARQDQGLQEKLRARRSRRRKVELQEVEKQLLTGESDGTLPPPTWSEADA